MVPIQREVTHGGEDQEHHEHPRRSDNQGLPTSVVLNNVQAIESGAEVDAVENHLSDKRVVDTGSFEDDGAVVEEVVGAGKLLKHLQRHA